MSSILTIPTKFHDRLRSMRTWLKDIKVNVMTSTQAAWLAGMIDGEGTICLTSRGRQNKYPKLTLAVYNNHLPTIEWCKSITGTGSVLMKPMRGRKNASYVWKVSSQRAIIAVLRQTSPHMVTKKDKADALLKSWRDVAKLGM